MSIGSLKFLYKLKGAAFSLPPVICNPARQGNCPAVLFSMLKLSFSVVGSMLGFGLSALCLQQSELVTDTLFFGRCIPFFFGRSAFSLDLAFPFCKLSVVVINYGFCIVRNSAISILSTGLGGSAVCLIRFCKNSFALPTILRNRFGSHPFALMD